MATQTVSAAGGNWSASATWSPGSVPAAGDDVIVHAASGNLTIDVSTNTIRSFLCTGYLGTITHAAAVTLNIGGASAPIANIALILAGTYTVSNATTSAIAIADTSAATNTYNFNGATLGNLTIANGSTTTTQLSTSGFSQGSTATVTLTSGGFNTNGLTCTWGLFSSSNSNTRTLTMGASSITVLGAGTVWNITNSGGVTQSTSSIVMAPSGPGVITFAGGGQTYYNVSLGTTGTSYIVTGANTFNSLTVSPGCGLTLPASTTTTATSLTLAGQSNGYLFVPGVSGNYVSTPNATPLEITGSITLDAYVALASWTPAVQTALVSKFGGTAATRAYSLQVTVAGKPQLSLSNGTTTSTALSSVATGFAAASANWVRASWTESTGVCQFFTSSNGTSWTQLGTNQTIQAGVAINNPTQIVEFGTASSGAGSLAPVSLYEARIYASALGSGSGTPVLDANFATKTFGVNSFTESSSNAATITINGVLAQAGDGRVLINSSTAGTQATLSSPSRISATYVTVADNQVATPSVGVAAPPSVLISNDTNWANLLQTMSGSLSPSGALSWAVIFVLRAFLTPVGVIIRSASRSLPGANLTPSGVLYRSSLRALSGTLGASGLISRNAVLSVSGALTPSGLMSRNAILSLSGTLGASGGLARNAIRAMLGALIPSGLSYRTTSRALSGNTTPSGVVARNVILSISASLAPSGLVSRAVSAVLSGGSTPGGTLNRATERALPVSTIGPSGSLARAVTMLLTGLVTPNGAPLVRGALRALSGSLVPSATLSYSQIIYKTLSGSLSSLGALTKVTRRSFPAGLTPVATLVRNTTAGLSGAMTLSGRISRNAERSLSGGTSPSGGLARAVGKHLTGTLSSAATLVRNTFRPLPGGLAPSGSMVRHRTFLMILSGALGLAGRLLGIPPKVVFDAYPAPSNWNVAGVDPPYRWHITPGPPVWMMAGVPND